METASEQGVLAGWLREERELHGVPGIAAALAREGRVETAADGVAELASGRAVTVTTPFRIASITKPFTAALALLSGLPLDEPPAGTRTRASVRELLSHTGGLASEWPRPVGAYGEDDDALARLAADTPEELPLEPGELYSYSNAGFWLVGAAVAARERATYEAALARRVLEPLGLRATGFDEPPGAARGHVPRAAGATEHRPAAAEPYPRARRPSGGLWSCVDDLVRFGRAQLEERRFAALHEPQAGTSELGYGLGWMLRESGGRRLVEHWGSVAGYQSLLALVREEGLVLAVLTNGARGADAIVGLLERLELGFEVPETHELPDAELARFAGRYAIQNLELDVAPERGGLRVAAVEVDPVAGERIELPVQLGRALGPGRFAVVEGTALGDRFDFPRPGLARVGGVVALRVQ